MSSWAIPLFHPLQDSDDAIGFSGKAKQRRDHLFALQEISLAERYAESRLSVMLDLCLKGNHLPVKVGAYQSDVQSLNSPVFMLEFHAIKRSDREHWNQETVFIVDVEFMEGSNIGIPSFVRFHAIDNKVEERRGTWHFSSHFGLKISSFLFGVDRELTELGIGARNKGAIGSAPRDVEGAMEIVNSISNGEGYFLGQRAISKAVVEKLFPRLRIDVQAGSVMVGRGEESLLDIRDVILGPFDF